MDNIKPIRNRDDLDWAIEEIGPYFTNPPAPGSLDADRFDVLADLIEAYENRHYPIASPDPVELIRSYMEMSGRTQTDLAGLFGSRSRASEVLNRKRALTVEMIHRLQSEWQIPAQCLVQPYELVA